MSVNEKIRLIREAKHLTQEQVAEKLGISPAAYGNVERGDNDPKFSKLKKIAEIFEMNLSELIFLCEKENVTINFSNYQENGRYNKNTVCIRASNAELEKLQLQLELKEKEIALLQREIAYLNKMLLMNEKLSENHP